MFHQEYTGVHQSREQRGVLGVSGNRSTNNARPSGRSGGGGRQRPGRRCGRPAPAVRAFLHQEALGAWNWTLFSRANLAVAGHQIRYAREEDPHVLPGANFIIEFKGILNVAS